MTTRTFSREAWFAAADAWAKGEFSAEWTPFRALARGRGLIYPPEGSRWDSWDADEPSQRAILVRAIRETPGLLEMCIRRSRSWGEVIRHLLAGRDDIREDADLRARDDAWYRRDEPTERQALETVGAIVERIRDSVAR